MRDTLRQFNKLEWQRERRRTTHNRDTRVYEKTPKGFLVRVYRNMLSRVSGIQKRNRELYLGLPILPKEQFYAWALADVAFNALHEMWVARGFNRKLTPSINRIDSTRGYEIDNIEWLTHSENSSLGASGGSR